MKRRFLAVSAMAAAMAVAGVAAAHAGDDCLDVACNAVALAPIDTGPATLDTATPHYGAWGLDLAGRDTSVKPGDNFYRYANGTWDDHFVIPQDKTRYGNFDILSVLSESRTFALIRDAADGKSTDPD